MSTRVGAPRDHAAGEATPPSSHSSPQVMAVTAAPSLPCVSVTESLRSPAPPPVHTFLPGAEIRLPTVTAPPCPRSPRPARHPCPSWLPPRRWAQAGRALLQQWSSGGPPGAVAPRPSVASPYVRGRQTAPPPPGAHTARAGHAEAGSRASAWTGGLVARAPGPGAAPSSLRRVCAPLVRCLPGPVQKTAVSLRS